MQTTVVISDLQAPYHNIRAVHAICNYLADEKPDELLNVGDDIDSPETSRWNKGLAGEYAPTLYKGLQTASRVHGLFRSAIGGHVPYHVMRSNHGDRTETYVRKYAPALSSLPCLQIEELIGYEDHGITYHRKPYQFAPGWLLMHGDEGGLSQTAGGTALSLARATGMSVVCGHTHRLGSQHHHTSYNGGNIKTRWGVEVGHLMDLGKAHYLKTGGANWHAGFGILYRDGNHVSHNLIPVKPDGTFIVGGKKWKP